MCENGLAWSLKFDNYLENNNEVLYSAVNSMASTNHSESFFFKSENVFVLPISTSLSASNQIILKDYSYFYF